MAYFQGQTVKLVSGSVFFIQIFFGCYAQKLQRQRYNLYQKWRCPKNPDPSLEPATPSKQVWKANPGWDSQLHVGLLSKLNCIDIAHSQSLQSWYVGLLSRPHLSIGF